jgi:Polyketide cyclase / dehydrase and lipid transport
MASIRTDTLINAPLDDVWAAVRDWGALHQRLAPGFVADTRLDGADRIVTFSDGAVVREVLVDLDDNGHRLAWTIVGGPYIHHNGSLQLFCGGNDQTRFVWTTDLLPNELASPTAQRMQQGTSIIKQTLETAWQQASVSADANRT